MFSLFETVKESGYTKWRNQLYFFTKKNIFDANIRLGTPHELQKVFFSKWISAFVCTGEKATQSIPTKFATNLLTGLLRQMVKEEGLKY